MIAVLAGCGQDRASLARQTVQSYWVDIEHAHFKAAYQMLTSGQRQVNTLSAFSGNFFGLLQTTAGIEAVVGKPSVNGDFASVPVTLKSPKAPNPKDDLHAYQHLYWESGGWHISDENGGLSHRRT